LGERRSWWVLALATLALLPGPGMPVVAQQAVAIGLVVPSEGPLAEIGESVRRAAEREILRANEAGGFRGRPFELRAVTEDGLWGQGLSRVVSLSFDQPVWGVIGGLDGRSAHLIQQVITKARVPFITPWASDFTLSRAMVPWFFQAVPDDRQQAEALARHMREAGVDDDVLVIADTTYDSRQFAAAVQRALADGGVPSRTQSLAELVERGYVGAGARSAEDALPVAVVLAVEPAIVPRVLERLAGLPTPPPVYAPLRLAVAPVLRAAADYRAPLLMPTLSPAGSATLRETGSESGRSPASLPVAFAEDAVQAMIAAIRTAGLDRWRIRDELAAGSFGTSTGQLSFGTMGRRSVRLEVVAANRLPRQPTRRP
jgi:branched-chain amino acid transport system substrate-binding protein